MTGELREGQTWGGGSGRGRDWREAGFLLYVPNHSVSEVRDGECPGRMASPAHGVAHTWQASQSPSEIRLPRSVLPCLLIFFLISSPFAPHSRHLRPAISGRLLQTIRIQVANYTHLAHQILANSSSTYTLQISSLRPPPPSPEFDVCQELPSPPTLQPAIGVSLPTAPLHRPSQPFLPPSAPPRAPHPRREARLSRSLRTPQPRTRGTAGTHRSLSR